MLGRGRILRPDDTGYAQVTARSELRGGRRVAEQELFARDRARAVLDEAHAEARAIRLDAEKDASAIRAEARAAGHAEATMKLAGSWLALRDREVRADELARDRAVLHARILAERLIGRALTEDPAVAVELAAEVLRETGGPRRIRLCAHPDDARVLKEALTELDPEGRVQAVAADASLSRGDLRLETESGTIDATLGPSLDRLAEHLREALGR